MLSRANPGCFHRVPLTEACVFCRRVSEGEPRAKNGARYQYRYDCAGDRVAGRRLPPEMVDEMAGAS